MFSVYPVSKIVSVLLEPWLAGMWQAFQKSSSCEIFPALAGYSWVNALTLNKRPFSVARGWDPSEKLGLITLQQNSAAGLFLCCQCYTLLLASLCPCSLPALLSLVWGFLFIMVYSFQRMLEMHLKIGSLKIKEAFEVNTMWDMNDLSFDFTSKPHL